MANRYVSHTVFTISAFDVSKPHLDTYCHCYHYYFDAAWAIDLSLSKYLLFILLRIPQFPYPHSLLLIFSHKGTSHCHSLQFQCPWHESTFLPRSATATMTIHSHTASVSLQFPLQVSISLSIDPVFSFPFSLSFSTPFISIIPSFSSAQSFPSWVFLTIHLPYYNHFTVYVWSGHKR